MGFGVLRRNAMRAAALALAIGTLVLPTRAVAQASPVQISGIEHRIDGRLIVSLRAPASDLNLTQVTALVDGVPRALKAVSSGEKPSIAVVIAIDTSASMAGTPLDSAKQAARSLIDRLGPSDEVSLVAFSDQPREVSPATADRVAVRAAIDAMKAQGNAALYDAVNLGTGLARDVPGASHILVVLSNAPLRKGEEVGGISKATRSESLQIARESGTRVYTFGLGADPDRPYLSELAGTTGGTYQGVADIRTLDAVFGALGERISASFVAEVDVPPLASKTHELTLRVPLPNRATAAVSQNFMVTNDGLLSAEIQPGKAPGDTIVIALVSPARLNAYEVTGTAGGKPVTVIPGTARALIDPWALPPGTIDVEITARVGGEPAGTTVVSVPVPRLEPQLVASFDAAKSQLVADGRIQAAPGQLIARANGREVARTDGVELTVTRPPAGRISVVLQDRSGALVAETAVTVPGAHHWGTFYAAIIGLLLVFAIASVVAVRRHRRPPPDQFVAPYRGRRTG